MNGFVEELAKKAISAGPWGGHDGMLFDDGVNSAVRQVVINHGTAIDSIQTEYEQNGSSHWSNKHGGRGGYKIDTVKLGYPDEYLTSINGHYGKLNEWGPQLVRSLTLKSNKRTYGPFGVEEGTPFSFPMTGVKIVGFHGVAGWYLDAIGVHMKPIEQKQSDHNRPLYPGVHLKPIEQKQNDHIRPLYHAQNYAVNTASETNLNGFSVIQGSLGQSYDIVLAVRQRSDDFSAKENSRPLPGKISEQFSLSESEASSDTDQESSKVGKKASKNKIKPRANNVRSMVEGAIKCGPWGGTGGSIFDDGSYNGIKQINVSRNLEIVYIRVLYDRNGEAVWGAKLGGTGGFRTEKVIFDYPNEVLTHITGTFSPAMKMGPNVIKSLTFHTTKGKHGPLGDEQGTPFTTKAKEGKIVGFHGRRGLFLDALGVHVLEGKVGGVVSSSATPKFDSSKLKAIVVPASSGNDHHQQKQLAVVSEVDDTHWPPNNRFAVTKAGSTEEAVAFGVVKEPSPCGAGPWGGEGGRSWDDGVFSGIKQIYLTRSDEALCSAQIEYDRNGQSVWSVKHGGNSGNTSHRVKLEFPNEVLSCVSGYHNGKVIRSLTFYTSRGKYGPYGDEIGTFFTSTTTEGKMVGFHGRSSLYLDAIGVHMQHWLGNQRHSKPSRFKMF